MPIASVLFANPTYNLVLVQMSEMTKIEYRTIIKFLTKEKQIPLQTKQLLDGVYGEAFPSYSPIREAKRFKVDERPSRLADVLTPKKIAVVEELVQSDHHLKVK